MLKFLKRKKTKVKSVPKVRSFKLSKETPRKQAEVDGAELARAFKELQINEFIKYLRSPWRIVWHNFLAGVFRGLGIIVGMTVVFGVVIWFLAGLVDFPLVGQYFGDLKIMLEQFSTLEVPK